MIKPKNNIPLKMEEIIPNSNLSIKIHQAHLDFPKFRLLICPQISVIYNEIPVRTKVVYETSPIWEETFNFEYSKDISTIILYNNPPICKETILGSCNIKIQKTTGWFELKNNNTRVGSVRLTIKQEKTIKKEIISKILEIKKASEEVLYIKKKYIKKLLKLKQHKNSAFSTKENFSESFNISNQKVLLRTEQKEFLKKKALVLIQEENLEQEKILLQEAKNEIEKEKKEIQDMILRANENFNEVKINKLRLNLQNRISDYSKTRILSPRSNPISQRTSETQFSPF